MYDILATLVNTNGVAFPSTKAVNSSGGGATDGTELVKAWLDDIFGFFQALLSYTGGTPNGSPEEASGVSQLLDSIKNMVSAVTTISSNGINTQHKSNKRSFITVATGCTALRLVGGTDCDKTNRIMVYNNSSADCVIDFGATASVEFLTLIPGQYIELGYNETTTKYNFIRSNKEITITVTADYTIADWMPSGSTILINHSATTKLVNINLPALANNLNKKFNVRNIGSGLTYINRAGSDTIKFLGNSLTVVKLLMEDDFAEMQGQTASWKTLHANINMITNLINRSDWTSVYIGSAFTYDNKSSGVDLTGQHIFEATSNQKAIILFDSGGTGTSGIMYVYNITDSTTGLGIWTNNRVITCGSGGYTVDVNETNGTSKGESYEIKHNFGISEIFINKKITIYNGTYKIDLNSQNVSATAATTGLTFFEIDTNTLRLPIASGIAATELNYGSIIIDSEDYYFSIKLSINF